MKKFQPTLLIAIALALTACGQNTNQTPQKTNNQDDFVGCYSVEKGEPAQIKIDNADSYTMQMKEPNGGWDAKEPLEAMDIDTAWELYKVNALGLNKSDIKSTLVRPDGVMAISRLGEGVAVNPNLDSTHLVNIFGATNTIYPVECDDVGLDLAKEAQNYHGTHNATSK